MRIPLAESWIRSQQANAGGRHVELIRQVMSERGILQSPPGQSQEVTLELQGPRAGRFAGAEVTALARDAAHLQRDLERLIAAGRIKWSEPNQVLSQADLLDAHGEPYIGAVRWTEGRPVIERVTIL